MFNRFGPYAFPNDPGEPYAAVIIPISSIWICSILKYESVPHQDIMNLLGSFFYFSESDNSNQLASSSSVKWLFSFIFKYLFVMKNKICSSCEDSSILTSFTTDVEINCNYSLNAIISLEPIPCFHFVTIMLYMWRVIIGNTTMSDWGWWRNYIHKWSVNSVLHSFLGLTVTNNFFSLINIDVNSYILVHIFITSPSFSFVNILKQCIHFFTLYKLYFCRKFYLFLESLILNLRNKSLVHP